MTRDTRTRVSVGSRGFSLVEVLVALIVICVGLLGVAKMQALALSNMTTSRQRALAAFEAAALAGAMHSNRNYWASTPALFPPNYTVTVNLNPAAAAVIASSDAALSALASADYAAGDTANGTTGLNACVAPGHSPNPQCPTALNNAALAAYDLARWTASLKALLPNPTATISCPNVAGVNAPVSCTIQISWTEKAVSMTAQEAAQQAAGNNGQFETPTYLLYVEP
jgi:type IV pilus assembly protein PilV